jgi:hypothetical protein
MSLPQEALLIDLSDEITPLPPIPNNNEYELTQKMNELNVENNTNTSPVKTYPVNNYQNNNYQTNTNPDNTIPVNTIPVNTIPVNNYRVDNYPFNIDNRQNMRNKYPVKNKYINTIMNRFNTETNYPYVTNNNHQPPLQQSANNMVNNGDTMNNYSLQQSNNAEIYYPPPPEYTNFSDQPNVYKQPTTFQSYTNSLGEKPNYDPPKPSAPESPKPNYDMSNSYVPESHNYDLKYDDAYYIGASAPPTEPYHIDDSYKNLYTKTDNNINIEPVVEHYVSPPVYSVCQKHNIDQDNLIDMKGRKQLIFVDDSYSNITEAFLSENRSGQIIDAGRMLVEFNAVHNKFSVIFKLLNSFWMDNDNITTPNQYDDWVKNIDWNGGTNSGERLNIILEEYFEKWESNPNMDPINIIYIGDGAIEDVNKYITCVAHASDESARRKKPRQITFQVFQVGSDINATKSFQYMNNLLKTKFNIKNDIFECICDNLSLKDKSNKAIVGTSVDYDNTQPNY